MVNIMNFEYDFHGFDGDFEGKIEQDFQNSEFVEYLGRIFKILYRKKGKIYVVNVSTVEDEEIRSILSGFDNSCINNVIEERKKIVKGDLDGKRVAGQEVNLEPKIDKLYHAVIFLNSKIISEKIDHSFMSILMHETTHFVEYLLGIEGQKGQERMNLIKDNEIWDSEVINDKASELNEYFEEIKKSVCLRCDSDEAYTSLVEWLTICLFNKDALVEADKYLQLLAKKATEFVDPPKVNT